MPRIGTLAALRRWAGAMLLLLGAPRGAAAQAAARDGGAVPPGTRVPASQADTLRIGTVMSEFRVHVAAGDALVQVQRRPSGRVRIGLLVPDTTSSWRDGVSIMIDPVGDATPAPGHDDYQLDFRRVLDSSVVRQAAHGTWMAPGNDPDWRLGKARGMETWQVQADGTDDTWKLELEIDEAWLAGTTAGRARLGLLFYDNEPSRWSAWPTGPAGQPATRIEMRPAQWRPVLLQ